MAEITWISRYSETDEPDEQGRWARIALVGNPGELGFTEGKPSIFQLAWITRGESGRYVVSPRFPYNGGYSYASFQEAKDACEEGWRWFFECINHPKTNQPMKRF